MSVRASSWAWDLQGITPTQKLVLLCLADHYNDESGACWPSIARMVSMTGLSKHTVQAAIKGLATAGLVVKETRIQKTETGHRHLPNTYRLTAPSGATTAPGHQSQGGATTAPGQPLPQGNGDTGVGQPLPQGGATGAPGVGQPLPPNHKGNHKGTVTNRGTPVADGPGKPSIRERLAKRIAPKPAAIRQAIESEDLIALLRAFGVSVTPATAEDWHGAADGEQLGQVLAILHRARHERDPIRWPSGMRKAIAEWRGLPLDDRQAIALASCQHWGLMDRGAA